MPNPATAQQTPKVTDCPNCGYVPHLMRAALCPLHAAAPALLAALQVTVDRIEAMHGFDQRNDGLEAARAAIRAAKGVGA